MDTPDLTCDDFELMFNAAPDVRFLTHSQHFIRLNARELDGEGRPYLTKRCETLQELDTEIDAIRGKLDRLQKHAHLRWGGERG